MVREYLAGRTFIYTHPTGYLLLGFAAFAFSARLFGGASGGSGDGVFVAVLEPFVAGVSRLLFWRSRLNYAP